MKAQINMNENVTVKLTEHGIDILRERHYKWERIFRSRNNDHVIRDFVAPENGMYTAQMWHLFEVFGEHMGLVKEKPFHLNIALHNVEGEAE